MTEYVDLQCPVCAAAVDDAARARRDYVRTGKVKLEARTLHFLGPDSERAAQVAAGAEQQGRLWPFLEAFYAAQGQENSGYVTDEFLRRVAPPPASTPTPALAYADSAGRAGRSSTAPTPTRSALGVDSTPTFTVARGDGRACSPTAPTRGRWRAALDAELAR